MRNIDIVSPVYREQDLIEKFHAALDAATKKLLDRYNLRFIYVVDPSPDETEAQLAALARRDGRVKVLVMSRRFGHQAALIAGIDESDADAVVMLDSDLQHPPELIPELVAHWENGAEIVQAVRQDGKETHALKRRTSDWFYRLLGRMSTVGLKSGAADYRLLSRRVADVFKNEIREHNPFLRGLVSWVGYHIVYVPFEPLKRASGRSKYSVSALFMFALNGICSFSKLPLRAAIVFGIVVSALSLLGGFLNTLLYVFSDRSVPGWASLFALVSFIGGIQILSIGIIGEYISLIFDEVKNRPRYLVSRTHGQAAHVAVPDHNKASREENVSAAS